MEGEGGQFFPLKKLLHLLVAHFSLRSGLVEELIEVASSKRKLTANQQIERRDFELVKFDVYVNDEGDSTIRGPDKAEFAGELFVNVLIGVGPKGRLVWTLAD
ncbi:hypothetical protein NC651_009809 [Populus alba x Populus x berolinensis]|nr:hypothetical protein NC651_009809 [Populus alba x Populus x berolinensis]